MEKVKISYIFKDGEKIDMEHWLPDESLAKIDYPSMKCPECGDEWGYDVLLLHKKVTCVCGTICILEDK